MNEKKIKLCNCDKKPVTTLVYFEIYPRIEPGIFQYQNVVKNVFEVFLRNNNIQLNKASRIEYELNVCDNCYGLKDKTALKLLSEFFEKEVYDALMRRLAKVQEKQLKEELKKVAN